MDSRYIDAVNAYRASQGSIASSEIQERESLLQSRAGLLQAKGSTQISEAGATFSQKLTEAGQKFASEMGLDTSATGLTTLALKGAKYGLEQFAGRGIRAPISSQGTTIDSGEIKNPTFDPNSVSEEPTAETSSPFPEGAGGRVDLSSGASENVSGIPKVSQDLEQEESSLTTEAESVEQPAEQEASQIASQVAEDVSPEIAEATSTASQIAEGLGSAIPVIGTLGSLIATGFGISSLVKEGKDLDTDPYAAIEPKLKSAQNQIGAIQNQISADQFATKIGFRQPSFGSLAVSPTLDTSKMTTPALHL